MQFIILTQYYYPEVGAAQTRLIAVIRELKAAGHGVEVVTAMPNHPANRIYPEYRGKFYLKEEIEGVVVHRVWVYAATGAGVKRLLNYFSFVITSLWGLFKAAKPDYIFVGSPPLFDSLPGYLAAKFYRAKMLFHVADLWPDSAMEMGFLNSKTIFRLSLLWEKWTYRVSYRIHAVTEGIRHNLIHTKNVPSEKILFFPNGVDVNLFQPAPPDMILGAELGLEGKKVILYAGNIGLAQGLDTVLDAAQIISDRTDILFLFVGSGSDKDRLIKKAAEYKLANVRFLDAVPLSYVSRLYTLSHAGLAVLKDLPIFAGARPSKIFPIMASGIPVIYSGAGEGARLVEKARAGLLVPPENAAELAKAVIRLVEDSKLTKEMGENGRDYVEKYFSWQKITSQWLDQLGIMQKKPKGKIS